MKQSGACYGGVAKQADLTEPHRLPVTSRDQAVGQKAEEVLEALQKLRANQCRQSMSGCGQKRWRAPARGGDRILCHIESD